MHIMQHLRKALIAVKGLFWSALWSPTLRNLALKQSVRTPMGEWEGSNFLWIDIHTILFIQRQDDIKCCLSPKIRHFRNRDPFIFGKISLPSVLRLWLQGKCGRLTIFLSNCDLHPLESWPVNYLFWPIKIVFLSKNYSVYWYVM